MLTNMLLTGNALSIYELNVSSQWANKDYLHTLLAFKWILLYWIMDQVLNPDWYSVISAFTGIYPIYPVRPCKLPL